MIDVLVLDEADRMIEDGHFKELHLILNHIYTKRVEFKQTKKHHVNLDEVTEDKEQLKEIKNKILKERDNMLTKNFVIGKNIEGNKKIDMSKVVDLINEDELIQEMNPDDLVVEVDEDEDEEEVKEKKPKEKKKKKLKKEEQKKLDDEEFYKTYHKLGGI